MYCHQNAYEGAVSLTILIMTAFAYHLVHNCITGIGSSSPEINIKEPFVTVTPPQRKKKKDMPEATSECFHQEHKEKDYKSNNYILHIIERLTYNTV